MSGRRGPPSNTGSTRTSGTKELRERLSRAHLGIRLSEQAKKKLSLRWAGVRPPPQVQLASSLASQKTYLIAGSEGAHVEVTNMAKFCSDFGYNKSRMCELVRGKRATYRGWTHVKSAALYSIAGTPGV